MGLLRASASLQLATALLGLAMLPTVVQPCGHHLVHHEVRELVARHSKHLHARVSVGGSGSGTKDVSWRQAVMGDIGFVEERLQWGDGEGEGEGEGYNRLVTDGHLGEVQQQQPQGRVTGHRDEEARTEALVEGGARRALTQEAVPPPAPIRLSISYQRHESLDERAMQQLTRIVEAVRRILAKYIRVKRPVSGGLLADPFCERSLGTKCLSYVPDMNTTLGESCGSTAIIQKAHVLHPESCTQRVGFDVAWSLIRGSAGPASGAGNGVSAYGTGCTSYAGTKGEATDMYLYITAVDNEDCRAGAAAWALPCVLDMGNSRPLIGAANVCPGALRLLDEEALTAVLVHEMIHVLGFTDTMFNLTRRPDGSPRERYEVLQSFQLDEEITINTLVTPNVQEAARAHFGCPDLIGAQLEEEGLQGSAGSHWEYNHYQGEVMVASTIFAADGTPPALSNLTLAYLDDTGWYVTDRSAAGLLSWGAGAGCALPSATDCVQLREAAPRLFCDASTATARDGSPVYQCSRSYTATGVCRSLNFTGGCGLLLSNNAEETCKVPGLAANDRPDVFGWGTGSPSGRCLPIVYLFKAALGNFIYTYPSNSRDGDADAACFDTACINGTLHVRMFNQTLACPEGQFINLPSELRGRYQAGRIGPCPPAAALCDSQSCPASTCSPTGGECRSGTCYCHLAYSGAGCSLNLITGQSVSNVNGSGNGMAPGQSRWTQVVQLTMSFYNPVSEITARNATLQNVLAAWANLNASKVAVPNITTAPSAGNTTSPLSVNGGGSGMQAGESYDATTAGGGRRRQRRRGLQQATASPPAPAPAEAAKGVVTALLTPATSRGVTILLARLRDSNEVQQLVAGLEKEGLWVLPNSMNVTLLVQVESDDSSGGDLRSATVTDSNSNTGRTAMVIGIIVLVVVVIGGVMGVAAVVFIRRRRAKRQEDSMRTQAYVVNSRDGGGRTDNQLASIESQYVDEGDVDLEDEPPPTAQRTVGGGRGRGRGGRGGGSRAPSAETATYSYYSAQGASAHR